MGTKITKSDFARRAGVNPSTVTKICKTKLSEAWDGKRIDLEHPVVVSYLENKVAKETKSPGIGLDPLYDSAIVFCSESKKFSISSIQKEFSIGYERAKKIMATIRAAGLIPENHNPSTSISEEDINLPEAYTAPAEPTTPKLRGNAAANHNKKAKALSQANERQTEAGSSMLHEVPADIAAFADMTLRELVERFGTDTAFVDWLKATKAIEDINEKRLKNAQTKGELISRRLVKDHVIDVFNSAHLRLMKDGSKSISAGVVSKHAGGASIPEIEAYVSDIVGSFIRPIKSKITRVLKNA